MAGVLVMSQDLNTCQSSRMMVIEEDEALIYVKYCNLSSNGSSCSVSKVVSIVLLYSLVDLEVNGLFLLDDVLRLLLYVNDGTIDSLLPTTGLCAFSPC